MMARFRIVSPLLDENAPPSYDGAESTLTAKSLITKCLVERIESIEEERLGARPTPASMTDDDEIGKPMDFSGPCGARRRALPEARRFQISLRSRCTAMLAGLRTLIKTRHAPD
jgi:hypothetical protein